MHHTYFEAADEKPQKYSSDDFYKLIVTTIIKTSGQCPWLGCQDSASLPPIEGHILQQHIADVTCFWNTEPCLCLPKIYGQYSRKMLSHMFNLHVKGHVFK